MKLVLTKEAEFDFNEEKYTAIPSTVFETLIGKPDESSLSEPPLPKMIMFEDKEAYIRDAVKHDIDFGRSIYVSNKGQIFCYLNTFSSDEPTDSEETQGE